MRKFTICFCFIVMLFIYCLSVAVGATDNSKYIFIDAGHGGADGGAVQGDIKESNLNLSISLLLKDEFENAGYKVLLTRDGDYDLATDKNNRKRTDIKKRVSMINESKALLYVSVHMNTFSQSVYRGAQVFYNLNSSNSKTLAELVQDSMGRYLNNTNRKAKSIQKIYLIDNVKKPGCLVECGFMSNNEEFKLLQDSAYQSLLAKSIFFGCQDFLNIV